MEFNSAAVPLDFSLCYVAEDGQKLPVIVIGYFGFFFFQFSLFSTCRCGTWLKSEVRITSCQTGAENLIYWMKLFQAYVVNLQINQYTDVELFLYLLILPKLLILEKNSFSVWELESVLDFLLRSSG